MMGSKHYALCAIVLTSLLLAAPQAGADVQWGVHLASYRTETKARTGWLQLKAGHHDLLAPLQCHFVPVDVPAKGKFLRLIVGPLEGREAALELERALRKRGAYADTMPCPEGQSTRAASNETPQRQATQNAAQPPVASVRTPPSPTKPQVAAPAAPRAPRMKAAADTSPPATSESLRKYVPPPVVKSFKSILKPLSDKEQQTREQLPSPPESSAFGLTGKGHRVGFKSESSDLKGLPLEKGAPRDGLKALYGNMEEDFETPNKISPLTPGETSSNFKPYLGLGFQF